MGRPCLDVARENGIEIPTICFHEATTANAVCRICVVEVEGWRVLQPACVVKAATNMKVQTRSEKVIRSRKTILEMLASTMDLSESPEIQDDDERVRRVDERFPDAESRESDVKDDNPMYIRDYSKCLLCWRCVQVCADDAQYTFAINFDGRGYETQIGTFFDKAIPETILRAVRTMRGRLPDGRVETEAKEK
jgi:NADH dehydrogenase/NADH:ubiquinone oxidoreductase subunit G